MFTSASNKLNYTRRDILATVDTYSNDKKDVNGNLTLSYVMGESVLQELTIERNGDNTKFFGYGIVHKLNVKSINTTNKMKIYPTFTGLKPCFTSNDGWEKWYYGYPTFFTTEVNFEDSNKIISITGYDAIYFSNTMSFSELNLTAPYTIGDVANAIAVRLGLSKYEARYNSATDTTNTFELVNPEGANYDGDESLREVLDDIAEATQTIYYIEKETLVFKDIHYHDDTKITLTTDDYSNFEFKGNRRLSRIVSATELGDNVESDPPMVESTQIGSTQYIRDNAFWTLRKDIDIMLASAKARVIDNLYPEFTLDLRGNYLYEPLECFLVETIDLGNEQDGLRKNIICYLTNDTLTYNGGLTQTIKWEYQDNDTEDAANPATLGDALNKTFAVVDKVNKQIKLVVSQVEENTKKLASLTIDPDTINALVSKVEENANNIASLRMDSDSIFNSVQQVQKNVDASLEGMNGQIDELRKQVSLGITADDVKIEISKQLNQGVNAVTTSTGFTFNSEGLTIAKNTSDISTTVTEDGMKVMQNGNPLLTADHGGVKAQNLHATTYLIIGNNSRFEDYNNGSRTGCFWIGY